MCGIFCQLSNKAGPPSPAHQTALRARGPDAYGELIVPVGHHDLQLRFVSTVLALRGREVTKQPLQDPGSGSVLCWNGEAWSLHGQPVTGNDAFAVFELLVHVTAPESVENDQESTITAVVDALSCIRGPFAFVFYHAKTGLLFWARDCLGRRSLVRNWSNDSLTISSICGLEDASQSWSEVDADGIYVLDLTSFTDRDSESPGGSAPESMARCIAHQYSFPALNQSLSDQVPADVPDSAVQQLQQALYKAVATRTTNIRQYTLMEADLDHSSQESKVAILFSGGLDCSLLARVLHDVLPDRGAVDLLNVTFENPRVHKTSGGGSPYELCPDRITARKSLAELQAVCADRRWNLVEIDVPFSELTRHRQTVIELMCPHDTEMDLSIAIALYFAARGAGFLTTGPNRQQYVSSARVLLSGLGADELFGGYQRHGTAFARNGFPGLLDELQLDIGRLGRRNLGRDDRVMSHWGKEVRFPYLDEDLVSWALSAPVWEKCGFRTAPSVGEVDSNLDPEKRVLRRLAQNLGLHGIAAEKKRAIQFGTRSAKMGHGKVKGTQTLSPAPAAPSTRDTQAVPAP